MTGTWLARGVQIPNGDTSTTASIWNNIMYGLFNGIDMIGDADQVTIMNNTVYGTDNTGIEVTNGDALLVNNIAGTYTGSVFISGTGFNISYNDTSAPGTNAITNLTPSFINAANDDFRLADYDTVARDAGTSSPLTNSNLNFYDDIQGTARGYAWDIGADEVAVDCVYTLTENGVFYTTISQWEDAFECDLSAKTTRVFGGSLSAGDLTTGDAVILYRAGQALTTTGGLTISGTVVARSAPTDGQILLANVGTVPDIGTVPVTAKPNDLWRLDGANYWTVAGSGDDLGASAITVCKIDGTWASADTSVVIVDGWTTDVDNYIKIYTTTTARHEGGWHTSRYRLVLDDNEAFDNEEYHIRVDGLQVRVTNPTANYRRLMGFTVGSELVADIYISNCILWGSDQTTHRQTGIGFNSGLAGSTAFIWNNSIYDCQGPDDSRGIFVNGSTSTAYVYNNTVYNCLDGILGAVGTVIAKNNLIQECDDGFNGSFDPASDFNISDLESDAPGSNSLSVNISFYDAPADDFHLASTDTDAIDAGRDLSVDGNLTFSHDIDGEVRPNNGYWDIGADEYYVRTGPLVGAVMVVSQLPGHIQEAINQELIKETINAELPEYMRDQRRDEGVYTANVYAAYTGSGCTGYTGYTGYTRCSNGSGSFTGGGVVVDGGFIQSAAEAVYERKKGSDLDF